MTVFIDAGANIGNAITAYCTDRTAKVHAFEPNKKVLKHPHWNIVKNLYPNLCVHGQAVWIADGTHTFYLDEKTKHALSSSLMSGKRNLAGARTIQVKCIDLSRFVKSLLTNNITLRMDIEGAEYPVLDHICKSGAILNISKLIIEFHEWKFSPSLRKAHKNVVGMLLNSHTFTKRPIRTRPSGDYILTRKLGG